jgi:hypothetical protein
MGNGDQTASHDDESVPKPGVKLRINSSMKRRVFISSLHGRRKL